MLDGHRTERPRRTEMSKRRFAVKRPPGQTFAGRDKMSDVRVICALGKRGQLGLNGRMPWEANRAAHTKPCATLWPKAVSLSRGENFCLFSRLRASRPVCSRNPQV
jgi:hypothetical protein